MPKKHCVLNATAKERLSALHVVALAKNPSQVFQSATVKNAAELGNAAAIFVVVQAKSIISRHVQRNHNGVALLIGTADERV